MPKSAQERDRWLSETLDRFERPLVRYALRRVGDLETARDLVQESFLRLCRSAPPPEGDHMAPWLYRVCRNLTVDHLRKDGRMRRLENPETLNGTPDEHPRKGVSADIEKREAHTRLMAEVAGLPANQQEVVRLKFQDGLSYKQIGAVVDTSVSNVGWLLHAALKTLRARMGEHAPAACERKMS